MISKGIIISSLALSILFANHTYAERIDGNTNKVQAVISAMSWSDNSTVQLENGLNLFFGTMHIAGYPVQKDGPSNSIWCKRGPLGIRYMLDLVGIDITFENTSDKLMVVNWSNSTYNLGTFSGAVMFPGVKYSDAGNAAVLPNMPIPPKSTITKTIGIGEAFYVGNNILYSKIAENGWVSGSAYIRTDDSLQPILYLKIEDENGNGKYYTAQGPHLVVPHDLIAMYEKK